MPIRLFDDAGAYTADGDKLAIELGHMLRPLFDRDHSPREVFALLSCVGFAEMAMARLQWHRRMQEQPQGELIDAEVQDVEE